MKKFTSRKFWLTIIAHLGSAYLVSKGHPEAAAALSSIAQGSYNIGQGMEDAAKQKAGDAVSDAIEGLLRGD